MEELETIDDDTDKHGIQFVKSKDSKLASDIGIFSFPALVYYETGVPIMYDGKSHNIKRDYLPQQKEKKRIRFLKKKIFELNVQKSSVNKKFVHRFLVVCT